MVWHHITCQEEGLNVFNFDNLAWLLRVARVAADIFLREIVMYHSCQSPSGTQRKKYNTTQKQWQSIIMVWHDITCQEEGLNIFNFDNLAWLLRVARVAADAFLSETVMYHPCQSPSMT